MTHDLKSPPTSLEDLRQLLEEGNTKERCDRIRRQILTLAEAKNAQLASSRN